MESKINENSPDSPDGVREMPKWAARYAHNRTLSVLVTMSLFFLAFVVIAGTSTLAAREGQAGHQAAAVALVAVLLAACGLWVWLLMTHRVTRLSRALSSSLYRAEGTAVAAAGPRGHSGADPVVAIAFGLSVALFVAAGFAFEIPSRYIVPIMAAFMVPFLLYLWSRQGGMRAPFMLLWPGLLVIHALLALAGVYPFSAEPGIVTILVPTVGYGAMAALASHMYSRVALRRLRNLAHGPEDEKTGGRRHA